MVSKKLRISLLVLVVILVVGGIIAGFLIPKSAPYTDIVETKYGPIRGEELSFEGTKYKAFKGIPYAAPPVGNLRFQSPQPPQKRGDVRDTRAYGKSCPQFETSDFSEDCLTLNVFTQTLGRNNTKAVLVWIHGGGFNAGDGTDYFYGPEYLIQKDIVVVTINYRLGPLGFLSTSTSDATGNWGMKDQVAALKWVQENIAQFGGDPKRVTIYGESAGGASVHLHLFSPLSKGLFQKAIPASGTAANSFATVRQEHAVEYSEKIARVLGASESDIADSAKRIEFLRTVDAKEMSERQMEVLDNKNTSTNEELTLIPFVPVIEPAGTEGAFLTEDPRKMLAEGRYFKVPLMIGVTDLEGGEIVIDKSYTKAEIGKIEENPCEVLEEPLKTYVIERNGCPDVATKIRNVYFDGQPFDSSLLNFAYLFSDIFMIRDVHYSQRWHARYSNADNPVYNYCFSFDGKWNLNKKLSNVSLPGAVHFEDIYYVFKQSPSVIEDMPPATLPEVITRNRMVRLITNFVKYGNPTPSVSKLIPIKWEPATPNEATTTFVIGTDLKLEKDFLKTRMDMWDQIYTQYSGKPLFP